MQEVEKWAARVLLLNSGLALAVSFGLLGGPLSGDEAWWVFGAALLGFIAAVLSLRRHPLGLWGGALYYTLQVISYFPASGAAGFSIKAGVSIGLVLHFSQSLIVVNMVALALLAVTITLLVWRRRHASR